MKKNEFKKQTDLNIIALDYLKIAGVNSLEDLKKTVYWEYYLNETRNINAKPKAETIGIDEILTEVTSVTEVMTCLICNRELGHKENGVYHLEETLVFSNNNKVLKILCPCGEKCIFTKIEEI